MTDQTTQIPREQLIAQYFIYKNQRDKKQGLTNKKLQKLLYYAQAWNLVFNKKKLFNENIEAWIHGPTIPSVYHLYKRFGYNDIQEPEIESQQFTAFKESERQVLDAVWEMYGKKYDGNYLEYLAHSEEPWQKARQNLPPLEASTNVISTGDMREYYSRKLKRE